MKKIIILTSLILFLLIGIGICSQEPPPTPPKSSEIKQDTSTQKQTNSQSKQQIANKPIPCIEKRPAQTTDTKESDNANNVDQCSSTEWNLHNILMLLFNALLACFTFLLWWSTYKMWKATQMAANAAQRSAESLPRIERAYIFAEIKHLEYLKNGSSISVSASILMKNYGRTPAILNSVCGVITLKDARINEAMLIDIPPGFILGVGIDETNPCPFNVHIHLRDEEWQNVERENITAYCCGKIIYNDIFHASHETGFCWEFKPRTPPQWFISNKYKDLNYYT